MDYDGQPQAAPDITTRGIMVLSRNGCVIARYYLNVFENLGPARALGAVRRSPPALPPHRCPSLELGGVPELEPGAATAAGIGS